MKKLLAILLSLMMLCAVLPALAEDVNITLWTYPIGSWVDDATVQGIIANFNAQYPNIKVSVQYLDYQSGDDQVTGAIEAGTTPDIIMEGPERLVTNWGAAGKMLPLNDFFTDDTVKDISSPAVVAACKGADGNYYEYPLCMTTHTMVINKRVFEECDALKYINLETRTWTTDDFVAACKALTEKGYMTGVVYCGGQGGDQGTRALVNNLYSGKYTNDTYTAYTANSPENVKALTLLQSMVNEGILAADPSIVAGDEIALFCNGTINMGFCWNASAAASNKASLAEGVEPFPVAFPSDDGVPELCGGIWGFGIFNNGDDARAEAAKTFIKFVCDDAAQGPQSVYATGFFPVRASFGDIYTGTEKASNADFSVFMPYLGPYYNVIPGWAVQRTEWWNMLQRVFAGGDPQTEADVFVNNANAAIK